jgi:hypothetical protein
MKNIYFILLFVSVALNSLAQVTEKKLQQEFKKQTVSPKELKTNWDFYGIGKAVTEVHNQFVISEDKNSLGAMVVSPDKYGENVVVRYKVMALTPASVLVVILSASSPGESELNLPEAYNGAMPYWRDEIDCYFFAFRNAAHNRTPFVRRFPKIDKSTLASAEKNVMQSGIYHEVEAGRMGKKLWLKIDGELMFETEDPNPCKDGKIAIRTRGTAHLPAAFIMKDLEIYSKR